MYFLEAALLNVKKGRIFMISLHQVGQPTSALLSKGIENAMEVTDTSAGYGLRIRTEIEDLDRNIALIIMFE